MTRLHKLFYTLIVILGCNICNNVTGQNIPNKDTIKILLIGNSFSQNASRFLPKIAEENGIFLKFGHAELGGCPLQKHWELAELDIQGNKKGQAYNGKSLRQLLEEENWDFVTLQQASIFSGDSASYHPYIENLSKLIQQLRPQAKIWIQQTWPYRIDAPIFSNIKDSLHAQSAKEMWYYSRRNYHQVSKLLSLPLIPVGDAFELAQENLQTNYKPDTISDSTKNKYPLLPNQSNSIHVGYYYNKNKALTLDPRHANDDGCYLAGLIWANKLLKINPDKVLFKPKTTSTEKAKQLRHIALFFSE